MGAGGGGGGRGGGGPDATFNTEIHKNLVLIKAPNSVNASKHSDTSVTLFWRLEKRP